MQPYHGNINCAFAYITDLRHIKPQYNAYSNADI